eukprot:scaffold11233_cov73-Cylindrotheca_fusiformis.AAC.2
MSGSAGGIPLRLLDMIMESSNTMDVSLLTRALQYKHVDVSMTQIPANYFGSSTLLVHVQLPETLTRIGEYAFSYCSNLKCVQFVSNDELGMFSSNPDLEDGTIVFPERTGELQIDEGAFDSCDSLRKVIVCSNRTKLGEAVFRECHGLLAVELPEGIQVIEKWLFAYCKSLTTVKIPSSVIKIGDGAFKGCFSLPSFDLPNGLLEIGKWTFQNCFSYETHLHIPSTVSSIGEGAFEQCGINSITLPPTLEKIERRMLKGCEMLENFKIPPTVSTIGQEAFSHCSSLSHIRIPPTVERIAINAFIGCNSLISIELPEGILIDNDEDADTDEDDYTEYEQLRDEGLQNLVNLAIPTLPEDDEVTSRLLYNDSRLFRIADNEADLICKLRHRFENSPLNKLCYYQSCHSSEDAMKQLRSLMKNDPLAATTQVDEFGMTPLHVLSLSQTPNVDMLLAVMKEGNTDHLVRCRDKFGSTPMDYLCLNWMPGSIEVIQRVLQTRFANLLIAYSSLRANMLQAVKEALDEALAVGGSFRMRWRIGAIYSKLANHEQRQEILFEIELWLWKIKIDSSEKEGIGHRARCRINSGACIVIPHVLPFLEPIGMDDLGDFAS